MFVPKAPLLKRGFSLEGARAGRQVKMELSILHPIGYTHPGCIPFGPAYGWLNPFLRIYAHTMQAALQNAILGRPTGTPWLLLQIQATDRASS